MTLRAMAPIAVVSFVLALVAGCGGKNASSPSDAELAYSATEGQDIEPSGIFLVDRVGKHYTRLTRPALIPEAQDVSWSPRSDLLLFHSASGEIWTMRSDGSDVRKIADGDSATWSPDGKMIAIGRGSTVDILSPDGELQKRISPRGASGSTGGGPNWSPDGTKVAFAMGSDEYSAIFVASVKGEGGARLVNPRVPLDGREPRLDWSPDGGLIAFMSSKVDAPSIWTMRPDGSRRKRVVEGAFLRGWAPNGRGFLCTGVDRDHWYLHECPLDGGSWRPLARSEEKRALQRGRHSPDGRQLAYVALSGAIVVSRVDGSQPRLLTDAGSYDSPQWSPDGERLAFVRNLGASEDDSVAWVYVIGRDGKGARRLVRGESAVWLPDGAGLVVQRTAGIFVATLEGKTRLLAKGWGVHYSEAPVLSPDGATVAYVRSSQAHKTVYIIGTAGGRERRIVDFPATREGGALELGDLAWSSDGKALLVVWPDRRYPEDYEERFATLFEVDLLGNSKVVATEVNVYARIAVSPSDGRVAFVGNQGLEVVDLKTRKRRTLVRTRDPDAFANPQWSDDGSTIAYLANDRVDEIPYGLETVRADGTGRTRISPADELVESFSWRPTEALD